MVPADVPDITRACQLRWLGLLVTPSPPYRTAPSTMSPLSRRHYAAPGGSPWTTAHLCLCTSSWTPTAARTEITMNASGGKSGEVGFLLHPLAASFVRDFSLAVHRERSSSSSRPRLTRSRPLVRLTPLGDVQNSDLSGRTLPSELIGITRALLSR